MSCLNYALKGIASSCQPGLAGVKEVYLTYADDISAVTRVDSAHTVTAIVFNDTAGTFYRYAFANNTASLNSVLTKNDNGGIYYTHTLTMSFNKMTAQKHLEVEAMAAENLKAIVVDNNDKAWFLSVDKYITGTATEAGTGQNVDDRNGYDVTLEGQSAYLPFEYTGDIVAADYPTEG